MNDCRGIVFEVWILICREVQVGGIRPDSSILYVCCLIYINHTWADLTEMTSKTVWMILVEWKLSINVILTNRRYWLSDWQRWSEKILFITSFLPSGEWTYFKLFYNRNWSFELILFEEIKVVRKVFIIVFESELSILFKGFEISIL